MRHRLSPLRGNRWLAFFAPAVKKKKKKGMAAVEEGVTRRDRSGAVDLRPTGGVRLRAPTKPDTRSGACAGRPDPTGQNTSGPGTVVREGRAIGTTEHLPRPAATAGRGVPILLVEDNPGDVRLTREALRGGGITNPMDVVSDGAAALAYLHGNRPTPTPPARGWSCWT